eukprot:gene35161-45526_t
MCILAILIPNPDSQVPLIICSNRDEDFIRPTQKGHIRTETLEYSPIDKKGGGSWIGIEAKYGRCAVVLNYDTWRDGKTSSNLSDEFLSRGQLTMEFIQADKDITAEIYAEKVNRKSSLYRGFSLVVAIFVEPTIPPDETEIFDLDVESNIWTLNSFSLPNLEADEEDEVEDEVIL